jgi:antitoxin (DNA-binding transcriptional repressor) of toxin-antitoxin stability system
MVQNLVMTRVNIGEAKARLSYYLAKVESGETVILCRHNVPIAEIRPVRRASTGPRPVGIDRGWTVPETFFEPLPDELLDAFEGGPTR